MRLRAVEPADTPSVARLHLETALHAYAHVFPSHAPKPTIEEMTGRWRTIVEKGIGWLAEEGGDLLGVAGLRAEATGARLEAVYVRPGWWGRGVGTALVDRAEKEAVGRGWLPLRLWVLEKNDRSRAWYERRGWERDGDIRRTVWGPIDDVSYVLGRRAVERWRSAR